MGSDRSCQDDLVSPPTGEPVADDCTKQRPLTEEEQASIDDLIALSSKELKWLKEH